MEKKIQYFIIILLISISKLSAQSDIYKNCYSIKGSDVSFSTCQRNSSDFILPEDCCLQTVKCRDSDLDTDLCKDQKTRCIVSKINKTFIQNYIIKMKKSNYNIKEVSVQCSGNYLNLFFPLIFFLFYFVYL
jgi:hypothetical protein